jgi:hypothetical protein
VDRRVGRAADGGVGDDRVLERNMQPAGQYLGEEYYRAGGLPAVMSELLEAGKLHGSSSSDITAGRPPAR